MPKTHPLRHVRQLVDAALSALDEDFQALYQSTGRRSVAPERLLRASLLQILYSIRSERLLVEQLDYNLLFRWFVGLSVDDAVWNHSTFSRNRARLLHGDIARKFFDAILAQARSAGLTSDEHFSVDGTLIDAWASHKSFRSKDGGDDDNLDGRAATPVATSAASGARTTLTNRRQTPRRECIERASRIRRGCVTAATH